MKPLIPEAYEGREQALIKHSLLKSYLEKLVLIIGTSARRQGKAEICYVDCFAGPWGTSDATLEGTSISISLQTLAACKRKLATLGVDATMRALYIEREPGPFSKLSAFLAQHAPVSVQSSCLPGDFVDLRSDILQWCGSGSFTFFFVDPKGWKDVGIETLRPLLQRPRSEFLINFAYNFINRTASMAEWRDAMLRLLGQPVELEGLAPAEREEALVDAYRSGLKTCVPHGRLDFRPRTAYVKVLDPSKERTKYHLVYLTRHPTGIVEFMDISERVELVQRRVRAAKKSDLRERDTGIVDMFASDEPDDLFEGHASTGEVDTFWRQYLAAGARRVGVGEFADILESTNWLPGDLQASLVRLVKAGVLRNLDASADARRKKPLHPDKAERIELIG